MAVCPRCGMPFSYAETHVCEGRDKAKLWLLAAVVIGAVIGAPLGLLSGQAVARHACEAPGATNLCGLPSAFFVPTYPILGAVVGATVAAIAVMLILRLQKP